MVTGRPVKRNQKLSISNREKNLNEEVNNSAQYKGSSEVFGN